MSLYFQVLLNSLLIGGLYALLGSGFSLQWGISGIINLSYGAMIIFGSYGALFLSNVAGLQPLVSVFPMAVLLFIFGYAIYWLLLRRMIEKGTFFYTLIMTYAVSLVLENIMRLIWSTDYRMLSYPYDFLGIEFAGAEVSGAKVLVFIFSFGVIFLLDRFMSNTLTGKKIQATTLNDTGAKIIGIQTNKMHALNFAIGSALAGIGGAMLANVRTFSVVSTGGLVGKVFVIAILGGLGNVWGAFLGGITLGLAEGFGGLWLGSQWTNAIGFGILVLILILRPQGLISRKYWNV